MATNNNPCGSVSSCHYNDGWHEYRDGENDYAGSNTSKDYPAIIKFTTPSFEGCSEKVEIKLKLFEGNESKGTLSWALCSSDANREKYRTAKDVDDSYQIVKGTLTVSDLNKQSVSTYTVTITTSELKGSTTYYFFLWGNEETHTYVELKPASNHTITLYYNRGIVKIYTIAGWKNAIPYIYTENGWKMAIPYVYVNDTDKWKICSG